MKRYSASDISSILFFEENMELYYQNNNNHNNQNNDNNNNNMHIHSSYTAGCPTFTIPLHKRRVSLSTMPQNIHFLDTDEAQISLNMPYFHEVDSMPQPISNLGVPIFSHQKKTRTIASSWCHDMSCRFSRE